MNKPQDLKIQLPTLEVEGFRSFRDRARIEIRPLTLIYGRNQAGKSSLLRLLPALADSIFGNVSVLNLPSPAFAGATFKELGWLGPQPSSSPIIHLENPTNLDFLEIQYTDDKGIFPNRINIGNKGKSAFSVSSAGGRIAESDEFTAPYEGIYGKKKWQGNLAFSTMLPTGMPSPIEKRIHNILQSFEPLRRIQWFAAARAALAATAQRTRSCKPDGSDLAELLLDRADVTKLASQWMESDLILGESISIGNDSAGAPRIELRRTGSDSLPINLAGEGTRWLLPILLAACWAECGGPGAPTMLAIEEIEARLHPSLQILLFERLIKTVSAGIPCVFETHSIHLLRRIQLAIIRQELQAKDVSIYWVEKENHAATARKIEIQQDGTLKNWNPQTFEEEQELARQILVARWKSPGKS